MIHTTSIHLKNDMLFDDIRRKFYLLQEVHKIYFY
jgi:hypothetical protein